jgi:hypothetical protein
MAASLALRSGILDSGYWIDEGIAVGIASHDLADIPAALRQDGSPPLYYVLLHGWMQLVGTGEAATRALSLLFAVLAVPVAWWAGHALFDRRAGALAAAGAAGCPFLTAYAQETRMYSLVAVLSIAACASFGLAFLRGRRRHVVLLGLWLALLVYTHHWALFLVAGLAVAWLDLWRRGAVGGRDGARLAAALAALYVPWLPSLAFQASHTAAPWSERPTPLDLLAIPGGLFGYAAAPLLVLAVVVALRRGGRAGRDEVVRALVVTAVCTAGLAWLAAQVEPAWATRYLAVLLGPLLLALAATLRRGSRWSATALAGVAAIWLLSGPAPAKSNARTVATGFSALIRPGDLVVSTQPEQVPVLDRYLPAGVVYLTPLGVVPDPRQVDWRDGLARLRAGRAERELTPLLDRLAPGRRILLVTPALDGLPRAPWGRTVRRRTRGWSAALREHPRLRSIGPASGAPLPRLRSTVRAEVFESVRLDP